MESAAFLTGTIEITLSSSFNKYPAKEHAQNVTRHLAVSKGLIYIPGQQSQIYEYSDLPKPFRQNRYFYYLSGVNEADCHLAYDINTDVLTLFIPQRSELQLLFGGPGLTAEDAYDRYDVDNVESSSTVDHWLQHWAAVNSGCVYMLHADRHGSHKGKRFDYHKLAHTISLCRVIKDSHEINLIRRANVITAKAHRAVLKRVAKMRNEADAEAVFRKACTQRQAKTQAYEIIAGAGVNASILHYVKNDESLAGRQLMVLDAGCEWQLYASDVTRTFPLNGEWTKEARTIYSLVLQMQELCIQKVRAGIHFHDLHLMAHQIAVVGLMKCGILHNGTGKEIMQSGISQAFFPHGLGHHMGLDVHDVLDVSINKQASNPLEPEGCLPRLYYDLSGRPFAAPLHPLSPALAAGMVITIEPGIYFSPYIIQKYLEIPRFAKYINVATLDRYRPVGGVRIEDDILVKLDGYENLTVAPKDMEDLSRIIRGRLKSTGFNASTIEEPTKLDTVLKTIERNMMTKPKIFSLPISVPAQTLVEDAASGLANDIVTRADSRPTLSDEEPCQRRQYLQRDDWPARPKHSLLSEFESNLAAIEIDIPKEHSSYSGVPPQTANSFEPDCVANMSSLMGGHEARPYAQQAMLSSTIAGAVVPSLFSQFPNLSRSGEINSDGSTSTFSTLSGQPEQPQSSVARATSLGPPKMAPKPPLKPQEYR